MSAVIVAPVGEIQASLQGEMEGEREFFLLQVIRHGEWNPGLYIPSSRKSVGDQEIESPEQGPHPALLGKRQ